MDGEKRRLVEAVVVSPRFADIVARIPEDKLEEAKRNIMRAALVACYQTMRRGPTKDKKYRGLFLMGNEQGNVVMAAAKLDMVTHLMTLGLKGERWREGRVR